MDFVLGLVRRFPFIVLIAILAVGGYVFRDHLMGNVSDMRVGDCFEEPADMEVVTDVQRRPCVDAHDGEVFGLFTHPAARGASYPSDSAWYDYIESTCVPEFKSYTGTDFHTNLDLEIGYFTPIVSGWAEGDRGVTCYIYSSDGTKMTSSVRAVAQ